MISTIADVAIALADLHHAAGKHLGAQDAAARGLLASPGDETLWHACLRAARARGDIAETTRLMTRFKAACAAQ